MTIGDRIKSIRTQKGMTQDELGALIGVKKQAIYKYEQGIVVNLKRDVIAKLAAALEVAPSYLLGFEDDDYTAPTITDKMVYTISSLHEVFFHMQYGY